MQIMRLFDFAAAFPSVAHMWIFLVLHVIGAPLGFMNVVECMYEDNAGFMCINGTMRFLFSVCSGVLQGCPLSGALFNFAIDPFL